MAMDFIKSMRKMDKLQERTAMMAKAVAFNVLDDQPSVTEKVRFHCVIEHLKLWDSFPDLDGM